MRAGREREETALCRAEHGSHQSVQSVAGAPGFLRAVCLGSRGTAQGGVLWWQLQQLQRRRGTAMGSEPVSVLSVSADGHWCVVLYLRRPNTVLLI